MESESTKYAANGDAMQWRRLISDRRFGMEDYHRTDGGSGLGLSIARTFTEACGGRFSVETIADLFVVTVEFARQAAEEQAEQAED